MIEPMTYDQALAKYRDQRSPINRMREAVLLVKDGLGVPSAVPAFTEYEISEHEALKKQNAALWEALTYLWDSYRQVARVDKGSQTYTMVTEALAGAK